jgi:hypothetical protein
MHWQHVLSQQQLTRRYYSEPARHDPYPAHLVRAPARSAHAAWQEVGPEGRPAPFAQSEALKSFGLALETRPPPADLPNRPKLRARSGNPTTSRCLAESPQCSENRPETTPRTPRPAAAAAARHRRRMFSCLPGRHSRIQLLPPAPGPAPTPAHDGPAQQLSALAGLVPVRVSGPSAAAAAPAARVARAVCRASR